eukprot:4319678-Pleurochrysis_carterae.AAC.3
MTISNEDPNLIALQIITFWATSKPNRQDKERPQLKWPWSLRDHSMYRPSARLGTLERFSGTTARAFRRVSSFLSYCCSSQRRSYRPDAVLHPVADTLPDGHQRAAHETPAGATASGQPATFP